MTGNLRFFFTRRKKSFVIVNCLVFCLNYIVWRYRSLSLDLEPAALIQESSRRYKFLKLQPVDEEYKENVERWSPSIFNSSKLLTKSFYEIFIENKMIRKKTTFSPSLWKYDSFKIPSIDRKPLINCRRLLNGDEREMVKGKQVMEKNTKIPLSEESYIEWTRNCSQFKTERKYIQFPISEEESLFPLAFSIATFRDVEQTERLLRSIYQPQNYYCIHVDIKSPMLFHKAISSIADCFDNVWIASKLHKIKWGDISVIMPEITCIQDLLKYFRGKYKYFINLTGQEFPLRTNMELVRIAKIFNGSNDISGSNFRMEKDRVKYEWGHRWSKTYQQTILYNTQKRKDPYPLANLTFFKGETHGLFSAQMTEYLVESKHGRMFFKWCHDTAHASEHYWNTLNYNPSLEAPGRYTGDLQLADLYSIHPVVRAKNWVHLYDNQWPCHGKVVRGICIFALEDVVWLTKRPEMFVNKFYLNYEYLAYDCLEEWHRNKTMSKLLGSFDQQYYENLPTVKFSNKL